MNQSVNQSVNQWLAFFLLIQKCSGWQFFLFKNVRDCSFKRGREDITARLAQSAERTTFNRVVVGSIPTSGVTSFAPHHYLPPQPMWDVTA
jgi:hypothetical protein